MSSGTIAFKSSCMLRAKRALSSRLRRQSTGPLKELSLHLNYFPGRIVDHDGLSGARVHIRVAAPPVALFTNAQRGHSTFFQNGQKPSQHWIEGLLVAGHPPTAAQTATAGRLVARQCPPAPASSLQLLASSSTVTSRQSLHRTVCLTPARPLARLRTCGQSEQSLAAPIVSLCPSPTRRSRKQPPRDTYATHRRVKACARKAPHRSHP
jgi:hypothetical protein